MLFASLLVAAAGLGEPGWLTAGNCFSRTNAAPCYVKCVVLESKPQSAEMRLAVAGWAELSVNGAKVGDKVLAPTTCQSDVRIGELVFDLSGVLAAGTNEIRVLAGNGWWYCATEGPWGFETAPWHSSDTWQTGPMIRGEVTVDGRRVAVTDGSWFVEDSPVVFNQLRNGEYYDARREGRAANRRQALVLRYPPTQAVSPDDAPPCRVFERNEPVSVTTLGDGSRVYDFAHNVAGWCEIEVEGEAGAKVAIDYDESVNDDGSLKGAMACLSWNATWPFQHDEYTLSGRGSVERWSPRFTYHGFRYARVAISGRAELKSIRQCVVHSDMASVGSIETSDASFSRYQDAVRRSYLANFVGIPTDCPHREKNGWTGDAQLACETGLWNFDSAAGYVHFLRMMIDAQSPNGSVPCILPCSAKFGRGWGTGPAWDVAIFEIPRQLYRFTGSDAAAREAYPAMRRYLDYVRTRRDADGLFAYGLGDWCHPYPAKAAPSRYTDTVIVHHMFSEFAFWAERFGDPAAAGASREYAARVRADFNRVYSHGGGSFGGDTLTELAAVVRFKGLCDEPEREAAASNLVRRVREERHRAVFGILGAKWVMRALAESGHVEDAWKIYVQGEYPSFQGMLENGDTLWESFGGRDSHNHIMYGDGSAWAFEYVAGIRIVKPGFAEVSLEPHPIAGVDSFRATFRTPRGEIVSGWETKDGKRVIVRKLP